MCDREVQQHIYFQYEFQNYINFKKVKFSVEIEENKIKFTIRGSHIIISIVIVIL